MQTSLTVQVTDKMQLFYFILFIWFQLQEEEVSSQQEPQQNPHPALEQPQKLSLLLSLKE